MKDFLFRTGCFLVMAPLWAIAWIAFSVFFFVGALLVLYFQC